MILFSRKSTTTNLFECLNDCTLMLDKNSKIYILYIDLEKACVSLTHEKLPFVLSKVGIGGNLLRWFSNFLTGRFFTVKISNVRFEFTTVNSGVPEGNILGPLLLTFSLKMCLPVRVTRKFNCMRMIPNSTAVLTASSNANFLRVPYPSFTTGLVHGK